MRRTCSRSTKGTTPTVRPTCSTGYRRSAPVGSLQTSSRSVSLPRGCRVEEPRKRHARSIDVSGVASGPTLYLCYPPEHGVRLARGALDGQAGARDRGVPGSDPGRARCRGRDPQARGGDGHPVLASARRRPRLGARADRARQRLPPLTRHPTRSRLAVRGVLLLLVVIMAFVFIAPLLRGWRLRLSGADTERPDPLVKDPFCGTSVLRSRAIRRESGGEALHFCSAECAARFARGDRPVS